jgi:hypothetical protein
MIDPELKNKVVLITGVNNPYVSARLRLMPSQQYVLPCLRPIFVYQPQAVRLMFPVQHSIVHKTPELPLQLSLP